MKELVELGDEPRVTYLVELGHGGRELGPLIMFAAFQLHEFVPQPSLSPTAPAKASTATR